MSELEKYPVYQASTSYPNSKVLSQDELDHIYIKDYTFVNPTLAIQTSD